MELKKLILCACHGFTPNVLLRVEIVFKNKKVPSMFIVRLCSGGKNWTIPYLCLEVVLRGVCSAC
jgi:hypothetical protein